jgi:TetR/AcrR family transcriptional regulator
LTGWSNCVILGTEEEKLPKQPFFNLNQEKRDEIKQIAMEEFIRLGYRGASTNRIVERAGISKGSLFYYFQDKDDLYTYLLQEAQEIFVERLLQKTGEWPKDILQRIRLLTFEGLNLYRELPLEQQLLNTIMDQESTDRRNEILKELGEESRRAFFKLFTEVNTGMLRYSLEDTVSLIMWMYAGIKMEINEAFRVNRDADLVEAGILPRLDAALKLLAGGIYKEEQ